jgi:hypothetical protein
MPKRMTFHRRTSFVSKRQTVGSACDIKTCAKWRTSSTHSGLFKASPHKSLRCLSRETGIHCSQNSRLQDYSIKCFPSHVKYWLPMTLNNKIMHQKFIFVTSWSKMCMTELWSLWCSWPVRHGFTLAVMLILKIYKYGATKITFSKLWIWIMSNIFNTFFNQQTAYKRLHGHFQ